MSYLWIFCQYSTSMQCIMYIIMKLWIMFKLFLTEVERNNENNVIQKELWFKSTFFWLNKTDLLDISQENVASLVFVTWQAFPQYNLLTFCWITIVSRTQVFKTASSKMSNSCGIMHLWMSFLMSLLEKLIICSTGTTSLKQIDIQKFGRRVSVRSCNLLCHFTLLIL